MNLLPNVEELLSWGEGPSRPEKCLRGGRMMMFKGLSCFYSFYSTHSSLSLSEMES